MRILLVSGEPYLTDWNGLFHRWPAQALTYVAVQDIDELMQGADCSEAIVLLDLRSKSCRAWLESGDGKRLPVIGIHYRMKRRTEALLAGASVVLSRPIAFEEVVVRFASMRKGALPDENLSALGHTPFDYSGFLLTAKLPRLSKGESSLMNELLRWAPRTCETAVLCSAISRRNVPLPSRSLGSYISRIRSKLAASQVQIETVRGVGYRLFAAQDGPPTWSD